ncbi:hypothetical protein KCP76_16115 [Salmonella enterica subsp. enterica serovar Weltevreden]|nr:hypothetical protein KCP76_16115 [Salmonella enterica subsp. enterica serovar Weltevreden]
MARWPAYAYCDNFSDPLKVVGIVVNGGRTAFYSRPNSDVDWHHCSDRRSGLFVALYTALCAAIYGFLSISHPNCVRIIIAESSS